MKTMRRPNQYLQQRGEVWHYIRRVPAVVANTVGHEIISRSLETDSVSLARRRRDMCAEADEARWHTLMPSAFKRPSVDHSLRQARKCDGLRLTFSTLLFMPAIGKYFVPEALNVAHFIFFTISTAFAYRAYKDTT